MLLKSLLLIIILSVFVSVVTERCARNSAAVKSKISQKRGCTGDISSCPTVCPLLTITLGLPEVQRGWGMLCLWIS